MRKFVGIASAAALTAALISNALAADIATGTQIAATAPLSPGKPAGVKQAQGAASTLFWLAGIGIVATGIVLLAENNHNNNTSSTATSGTNP
jgi:hypothetical protein